MIDVFDFVLILFCCFSVVVVSAQTANGCGKDETCGTFDLCVVNGYCDSDSNEQEKQATYQDCGRVCASKHFKYFDFTSGYCNCRSSCPGFMTNVGTQGFAISPSLCVVSTIQNIPDIKIFPLIYVFDGLRYQHKPDTLWLEFGVFSGTTINYISRFTDQPVYGFDSFQGLPETWRPGYEKGEFDRNGTFPDVNPNVVLVKGWFNETLPSFIQAQKNKKISFLHIDCDLYSSTKYVFDQLKDYIDDDCIIVFDELVNYPWFEEGELLAFYEFIRENNVEYEWIGMEGPVVHGSLCQSVAVRIKTMNRRRSVAAP
jgi:hypothetical protein